MGAGLRHGGRVVVALLAAVGAGALSGCAGMSARTTWSPDNKRIAYGSPEGKLCVYEVATKQCKDTAAGGEVGAPSWSPDGKKIAFYAVQAEKSQVDLQVMDTESGEVRTLASLWQSAPKAAKPKKAEEGQEPGLATFLFTTAVSWSPDSTRLVCTNSAPTAGGALLVEVASGEGKPILQGRHTILTISWAPDGRHLAYLQAPGLPAELEAESDKDQKAGPEAVCSLELYDVAGGESVKLCSFPAKAYALGVPLEWSADSGEIGFVRDDSQYQGRAVGCIIEAKPGATVRTAVRGIASEGAWAPGLRGLVFIEDREGSPAVAIYRGVAPPVRKVLGEIPQVIAEKTTDSSEGSSGASRSLPGFSRDGSKVAVLLEENVADKTLAKVLTFEVP